MNTVATCPTSEELSRYAADELKASQRDNVAQHLSDCEACAKRLRLIGRVNDLVAQLRDQPPPQELVQRVAASLPRLHPPLQVLTLPEVAEFLRVELHDLRDLVGELPAFELAGQLRVRRDRLLEWIAQRERQFTRSVVQSRAMRILSEQRKGVA